MYKLEVEQNRGSLFINRGVVKWYHKGLQNPWSEFDSQRPCINNFNRIFSVKILIAAENRTPKRGSGKKNFSPYRKILKTERFLRSEATSSSSSLTYK